jgi:RHS repeat-associated protein
VPVWSGSPQAGHWQFRYDDLDRPVSVALNGPGGAQQYAVNYSYDGLTGTETDPRGHRTTQTRNAWGDVASVRDALGGTTRYQHNPFGMLSEVKDAYGSVVSGVRYNARGMKISQSDMDLGAWTLSPNALGEITSRTDAKGQTTSFAYDLLGRPVRWTEAEGVTTLTWGASAPARNIGQLAALAGPGYSESYAFDAYSRLVTRSITSDATYQYGFSYNALGRLDTLTYPASAAGYRLALGYEYAAGQVVRIRDRGTQGAVLWQLGAVDARGNGLDETLGGSLRIVSGFGQLTGQMEYRQAGFGGGTAIQDLTFGWDHTGNLVERRDARRNLVERFTYDAANRLDLTVRNGVPGVDLSYDLIGNVTWKSDVCPTAAPCFSYHATRKHAVSTAGANSYAYDANGNMTSRNGAQVAWYSFNLPKTISQPGGNQSEFWYGPARNRWKQVATNSGVSETTLYVGGLLEKVTRSGAITWRHYIQGPDGTAAIHLRFGSGGPARTYYLTRDHQGSTDRIVDPLSTSVVVAESFDPFGRRRGNGGTGVPGASEMAAIQGTTRDGFTGHEHLDNLGLIHMNGRVYDPVIGRFMSADPVVQAPFSSQDLNRYSYAWNNPLSVVDPNGLEEVQCLHGPHGKCQGVTVTGMRDWPDSPAAYSLWRTGSNSQATSAAQRDPCGQDGSAMDCAASSRRAVSGAAVVEVMPGRSSDDAYDAWTGIGRAALNLVPGWYYSGQAGSALQSGNYLDAVLFYGATVSDVFLLGRGAAMTIVSRAARNEVQLAGTLSYGPANPGPLSEDIAATFRSSSYRARRLEDPMIVYRVIGTRGNPAGRFWTATEPKGALQSVIDLAIDQNWRNPATRVIQAEIPVGTLIYEGATAPQRGLVGGIEQIYIPRVDPRWLR